MNVLITGSSGLIGSALRARLSKGGHSVSCLVRSRPDPLRGEVHWCPDEGQIDRAALEGLDLDAVVHLAGESIASGRWNAARRRRIRDSRVVGTRLLAETLAGLRRRPRVFLSASATGYYGSRGDATLDETAESGDGFLAGVCRAWEAAADRARAAGLRVVHPRFGMILSPQGGALGAMLPAFRLGVAGAIGDGRQFMSWVTLGDALRALEYALDREELEGAVNVVAPDPVRNAEFTGALGRVLHRPTVLRMPAFAARLFLGRMAEELLLSSCRAVPRRLLDDGFRFADPEIRTALANVLGQGDSRSGKGQDHGDSKKKA